MSPWILILIMVGNDPHGGAVSSTYLPFEDAISCAATQADVERRKLPGVTTLCETTAVVPPRPGLDARGYLDQPYFSTWNSPTIVTPNESPKGSPPGAPGEQFYLGGRFCGDSACFTKVVPQPTTPAPRH